MAPSSRAKLVFNIEPAGPSEVRAMQTHERMRTPDGSSAIDHNRSHLNEVLHGLHLGPSPSLNHLYNRGVQKPDVRAEKPFLRIVIGASSSYFRPDDPQARGTWDQERVDEFKRATMEWLNEKFGDDLVYASLHLDEDTPHIHVLAVPTFEKKPAGPKRKKRGETDEEFAVRKEAAKQVPGVRVAGRSSHEFWSRKMSFDTARHDLAKHLEALGIDYGDESPRDEHGSKPTRRWVDEQAKKVVSDRARFEAEKAAWEKARSGMEASAKARVEAAKADAVVKVEEARQAFRAEKAEAIAKFDSQVKAARHEIAAGKAANAAEADRLRHLHDQIAVDRQTLDADRRGFETALKDEKVRIASEAIEATADLLSSSVANLKPKSETIRFFAPVWDRVRPMVSRFTDWWDQFKDQVESIPRTRRPALDPFKRSAPEDPSDDRGLGL